MRSLRKRNYAPDGDDEAHNTCPTYMLYVQVALPRAPRATCDGHYLGGMQQWSSKRVGCNVFRNVRKVGVRSVSIMYHLSHRLVTPLKLRSERLCSLLLFGMAQIIIESGSYT
jgi:hypothetical protein